jgi:hypothetical protein
MFAPRSTRALGVALFVAGAITAASLFACSQATGTGACPVGEMCSTLVTGLFFAGSLPTAHAVVPLAVGGSERIHALSGTDLAGPVYAGGFDPRSTDDLVLAVDLPTVMPATEVTVHGVAAGDAYLRFLQPGTQLLLDRTLVRVADAVGTRVVSVAETHEPAPPLAAVWGGASVDLTLALVDAEGAPLWDDALSFVAPDGAAITATSAPAGLGFTFTAPASGSVVLAPTRGASALPPITLAVVSSLTGVRPLLAAGTTAVQLRPGESTYVCALGVAAAGLVAGAPLTFTLPLVVTQDASVVPTHGVGAAAHPVDGCVGIRGASIGSGTLMIDGPGTSGSLVIEVVATPTSA